jgi:hypothetical protein
MVFLTIIGFAWLWQKNEVKVPLFCISALYIDPGFVYHYRRLGISIYEKPDKTAFLSRPIKWIWSI